MPAGQQPWAWGHHATAIINNAIFGQLGIRLYLRRRLGLSEAQNLDHFLKLHIQANAQQILARYRHGVAARARAAMASPPSETSSDSNPAEDAQSRVTIYKYSLRPKCLPLRLLKVPA